MKRITLEEAIDLFKSSEERVNVEIEAHWIYLKDEGSYACRYWCCDPAEDCGNDYYERYASIQAIIDEMQRMWGGKPGHENKITVYQIEPNNENNI